MKPFQTIRAEVLASDWDNTAHQYPSKEYAWYAYKDGQVTECETKQQALTISKLVESKQVNVAAYTALMALYNKQQESIRAAYNRELRSTCPELSPEEYSVLYNTAYDSGHANGYDSVTEHFDTYLNLYRELLAARRNVSTGG